MGEFRKSHVAWRYHHSHADIGQLEQALGKGNRQAHAAVRCRVARQRAGVQGDAGPGDALHERHVAVLVEVGVVLGLLLHDAEDAGRGFIARRARRNGRLLDHAPAAVVDRDALGIERDQGEHRDPGTLERHHVAAVVAVGLAVIRVAVVVLLLVLPA